MGCKLGGFEKMFASSHLKQTVAKDFLIMFLMMDVVSMNSWKSFAVRVIELVKLECCQRNTESGGRDDG